MRRFLVFILTIICFTSYAQIPDVPAAFKAINPTPQILHLKKNHIKIPSGGHLQGIQALSDSQLVITASSASYAYYLTANRSELTAIRNISIKPFRHAGGFQICDSIMVIGTEDNIAKDKSHVIRFLFDNSTHVIDVGFVVNREGSFKRSTAGAVGFTRMVTGRYLLAVGDWSSRNIDLYQSRPDNDKMFDSLSTFHAPDHMKWCSYQSLNLLSDSTGRIYLIGFALDGQYNRADLFEVLIHPQGAELKLLHTRNFNCKGTSFRYGSGIFISQKNKLQLYSIGRNVRPQTPVNIFK